MAGSQCCAAPKHPHECSHQALPQRGRAGSCHSGAKAGALPTLTLQHRREGRKEAVRPPPPGLPSIEVLKTENAALSRKPGRDALCTGRNGVLRRVPNRSVH